MNLLGHTNHVLSMGCLERIELSTPDPQTGVLPLNYRHHIDHHPYLYSGAASFIPDLWLESLANA